MKKLKDILLLFLIGCAILSCSTRKKTSSQEDTPSTAKSDTTLTNAEDAQIYGIAGDGCAMHTLEIITPQRDTLDLNMETARDSGLVIGDVLVGDKYAVTLMPDKESVHTAVNLTQIVGKWRLNGKDSGFDLYQDGKASAHNMQGIAYSQWRVSGNKLLLRIMNDAGRKEAFSGMDTLYMNDLTADSLITIRHGKVNAFARTK